MSSPMPTFSNKQRLDDLSEEIADPLARHTMNGGWTSNHSGGWTNNALNGGLRERTSRYLTKGKGEKLLTLALTFDRRNIIFIGWRGRIVFFWLFL